MKDLRPGKHDFVVTTQVERNGTWYMGDEVLVTARDEDHAKQIVREKGYTPNEYFPPRKQRK